MRQKKRNNALIYFACGAVLCNFVCILIYTKNKEVLCTNMHLGFIFYRISYLHTYLPFSQNGYKCFSLLVLQYSI